jgi:hypothetical protein
MLGNFALCLLSGLLPALAQCLSPIIAADCSRVTAAPVTLTGSIFDGCGTTSGGGAIYISSGTASVELTNCHFVRCSAGGSGGAISIAQSYSIRVTGFTGQDCSAGTDYGFCQFYASSSSLAKVVEFNESSGV